MDISEESLKKIVTVQYDVYKKALGVPGSTPNIAITMKCGLIKVTFGVMEKNRI